MSMAPEDLAAALAPYGVAPDPVLLARLGHYLALIAEGQQRARLVGDATPQALAARHLGESLYLAHVMDMSPVRRLVDLVGCGCGLAVSLIAPLRHDAHRLLKVPGSWLPKHKCKQERKEATVRLRRYFRRMGFRRLGRSPYYALPMNRVTPTAEELLGG